MKLAGGRHLYTFIFAAMLGWDGAALISALIKGDRMQALLAGAGGVLLAGIVTYVMTRPKDADRRTEP